MSGSPTRPFPPGISVTAYGWSPEAGQDVLMDSVTVQIWWRGGEGSCTCETHTCDSPQALWDLIRGVPLQEREHPREAQPRPLLNLDDLTLEI